jgi:hypothetical protein
VNISIHTIHLHTHYSQHELFRGSVIPYLETNRFWPRVRAVQKTRPTPYRAKVLGRALLAVRTDANTFWMLLSGNAEVAFPSSTTTTTPAAVTSTANVATVAASAMSASTTTGTSSLLSTAAAVVTDAATSTATPSTLDGFAPAGVAAANVATPYAGQKRRARP